MTWFDWVLVAWFSYGGFLTITLVGKPRKPVEPMTAAFAVVISALLVVGVVMTA